MFSEPINSPGAKPDEYSTALRRAGKWLAQAIAVVAAAVPLFVCAQAVNGHNVKYVKENGISWAQTKVGEWRASDSWITSSSHVYKEVERNDNVVRLKRTLPTEANVELDLAARQIRTSAPGATPAAMYSPRTMTGAWTVSGFSASHVQVLIYSLISAPPGSTPPYTTRYIGTAGWTELFDNGTSRGWRIDQTRNDVMPDFPATILTSAVTRTFDTISFPTSTLAGSRRITVDVTTGSCQYQGYHCEIRKALAVTGENVGQIHYRETNPHGAHLPPLLAKLVKTNSAGEWVTDTGNGVLQRSTEIARGIDWVDLASGAGKMRYKLDGTAQMMTPGASSWMNVSGVTATYVDAVWRGQLGTVFAPISPGVSPGFQIQNKTDYPVLVTLEQIGCLYYGIVQPGQVFQRNTGAVWFTIKASMAPDLTEPTVESCIRKPAMYAATIAVAGLTTVGTGGMGTALVVPAMLAAAAGQGAAIATQSALIASGATATDAMAGRVGVATLVRGATVVGFALMSSPGGVGTLALNPTVLSSIALIGGTEVMTRYSQQSDIDGLGGQLTQEASVAGAYAGYPWPWKMADRVMPRYDITGGPRIRTTPDGSTIVMKQESALTITRVN
jgi:hypothetical protein